MATKNRLNTLSWTGAAPPISVVLLAFTWGNKNPGPITVGVVVAALALAVLAAVHHAEVVAHRVGEPYGSLVLAVAVTIIEVALIVTLMISGGKGTETLARDTVFAAVMITVNGILGVSLFVGSFQRRLPTFNAEGTGGALATVLTLAALTLVLPRFTTSRPGPEFAPGQLIFAAIAALVLYGAFVVTQTVRHRDFFLPVDASGSPLQDTDVHALPPSARTAGISMALLTAALVGTVGLAKVMSSTIEKGVRAAGLPQSFVGVVIALLILLPETLAAVRAAQRGRIQISLNLALGSAMASIGLTIPTIAVATIWLDGPLVLGLDPTQIVLLAVTVMAGTLTVVPGRATRLQATVHLVLLAAFVTLAVSP